MANFAQQTKSLTQPMPTSITSGLTPMEGIGGYAPLLNPLMSAASGTDGRALVAQGLQAGAAVVGNIFGGPIVGAAAGKLAEPAARDIASLGMSTDATMDALGNRAASNLTFGATDLADIAGIGELDFIGDAFGDVFGGLASSFGFGGGNKGSEARGSIVGKLNDIFEEAGIQLDTPSGDGKFDDFYGDFAVFEEDGKKTSKVEKNINLLKEARKRDIEGKLDEDGNPVKDDRDVVGDLQRVGKLFAHIADVGDAGTGQMGDLLVLNTKGDEEQFKAALGAMGIDDPSKIAQGAIRKFADGDISVVETVEGLRALDRTYGTGFASEEITARIASLVEEGSGKDRFVDGTEFDSFEDGDPRRKDLLDDEGNPIDIKNSQLAKNLEFILTGEAPVVDTSKDASSALGPSIGENDKLETGKPDPRNGRIVTGFTKSQPPRPIYKPISTDAQIDSVADKKQADGSVPIPAEKSNLIDSFRRVTTGNSLTPNNANDDIRYSMQILSDKIRSEGNNPDEDPVIQQARQLLSDLNGEDA